MYRSRRIAHADLVLALAGRPAHEQEQIARMLGFVAVEPEPSVVTKLDPIGWTEAIKMGPTPTTLTGPVPERSRREPAPRYWCAVRVAYDFEADAGPEERPNEADVVTLADLGAPATSDVRLPESPPIVPWYRLRRALEEVHRRPRPLGEIDVPAVLREVAAGRPLARVPRRSRRTAVRNLVVIIDQAARLMPFWRDQLEAYARIRSEFGDGVSRVVWRHGPPAGRGDFDRVAAVSERLGPFDAVLVLGDLGIYAGPGLRRRWAELGRSLARCEVFAAALLPCPLRMWQFEAGQSWHPIDWSNPSFDRTDGRGRKYESTLAETLLALLSWTSYIEPALLRDVRALVEGADLGTEAAVWNWAGAQQHVQGLLLSRALRAEAQRRLRALLPNERRRLREVVALVRAHRAVAPREVWYEEAGYLALLDPEGQWLEHEGFEEVEGFVRRLRNSMELDRVPREDQADLRSWVRRATRCQDFAALADAWEQTRLGRDLGRAVAALHAREGQLSQRGLHPGLLRRDEPRRLGVWQCGDRLVLELKPARVRGSLLGELVAYSNCVRIGEEERIIGESAVVVELPESDELELRTTGQQMILRCAPRPLWASAVGCDEHGLWAEFRVGEVEQRLRWIPPGRFFNGRDDAGKLPSTPLTIDEGFLLAESRCTLAMWKAVMGSSPEMDIDYSSNTQGYRSKFIAKLNATLPEVWFDVVYDERWGDARRHGTFGQAVDEPELDFWIGARKPERPAWVHDSGCDEYGLWASFRVGEVECRMRWIPPGSFMMGSPEDERGRWEPEGPRHQVTLTRGFWLAETPCTQELWVEVMGDNPSRFVSPRRPVERVSWDDVQRFIAKLDERSDPGFGLPTEAQWEHACRAGTSTGTYAGAMEILGLNNAPVLDAIAWYAGNSGVGFELDDGLPSSDWREKQFPHKRAGTREVALKRPNEWGLFDMLGNVSEWCADALGRYYAQAVEDPTGVPSRKFRASRGGSWLSNARSVRASFRSESRPGDRGVNLGFRLARSVSTHDDEGR